MLLIDRNLDQLALSFKSLNSRAKIIENFSKYFFKAKANKKREGLQKRIREMSGKIKALGIATLQSRPCLTN